MINATAKIRKLSFTSLSMHLQFSISSPYRYDESKMASDAIDYIE